MVRTNMTATRVKPQYDELLTLEVLRREQISPHFVRVTLGKGDIDNFEYMGFDQWCRLFIPVAENSLSRLPNRLNTSSYLRYLMISKTSRPVLRNYSVRTWRPEGPELDIDFVIHGSESDGTAGPATAWAISCAPGDPVAILDEGIGFNPDPSLNSVRLVTDETGLPATAGILSSLPDDYSGCAIIEVPREQDQQSLDHPAGVDIVWLPREDPRAKPGQLALHAAMDLSHEPDPFYGWVVGESQLAVGLRRHWVNSGVSKQNIMFCGYWKDTAH